MAKEKNKRERILKFADALISCYSDRTDYLRLREESESLLNFLSEYPVFQEFLSSPIANHGKKEKFLKELIRLFAFQQRCLSSTILLLLQFELIGSISAFLESLVEKLEFLLSHKYIKVYSSITLNESQKKKLESSLVSKFGGNIKLDYLLSPEMIVGVRIEYDNSSLECSFLKQLGEIKKGIVR